jgi:hypothetical protein
VNHSYRNLVQHQERLRYRAMLASKPGSAPQRQGGGGRPRSFLVGTQDVYEGGDYDQTVSSGSGAFAATTLPSWQLQSTGWLARLRFLFTWTTTGGTAATADGPFNFIGTIQLNDVNNEAIFGPFNGYVWFVICKYGGYYFYDDPSTSSAWAITSGTSGTFLLTIPLEIVSRDPIGPVASVNNTASLTVIIATNTAGTAITGALTASSLRIRGLQEFYWEPRKIDKQGRQIAGKPPANGTTQYWTQGSIPVPAGTINSQLITGLGYPFREYFFILYDSGGTRATGETDWPDPLTGLKFEANFLLTQYNKAQWQNEISQVCDYPSPAFDTRGTAAWVAPGKENGFYGLFFNKDFFRKANGAETRRTYLVTSPGSNFIINGTFGGAGTHTLYTIVNYVAPGGGGGAGNASARHQDTAALTGGS